MVSLIMPQKTATHAVEQKQSDVIEEAVDVDDRALTSRGTAVNNTGLKIGNMPRSASV